MFIEDKEYRTNLVDIGNLRYLLFTNFYNNQYYIDQLKEIINKNIECLAIDYSSSQYIFSIKIKKTAMRKIHGFKHNPLFYHQCVISIFNEFIKLNQQEIIRILGTTYDDPYYQLNYVLNNPVIMTNLCHVSCISDNLLMIKL